MMMIVTTTSIDHTNSRMAVSRFLSMSSPFLVFAFSCKDATRAFIASSSAINFRSAAEAATVAFLGASRTTEAFFAKPSVAKVYFK